MISMDNQMKLIEFVKENSINRTQNLLSESVQSGLSDVVLDKMFALTLGKYAKIDFSEIERSRGDITKIKYYNNLRECIDILLDIHTTTDKIPGILVVSTALENMITLKDSFEHGFRVKNNMAIIIYNTIMYAIMESTSYLIATSIDFVKNADDEREVNIYTESKQFMLIDQLVKFNKTVTDRSIIKFIGESEKMATMQEGAIEDYIVKGIKTGGKAALNYLKDHKTAAIATASVAGVIFLGVTIIPLIREIIYWIYKTKQRISDAAELQAEFLQTNIQILREKGDSEKIIAKQEKHIKRFQNIARIFSLEADKATRDAKKDIINDKVDVSAIVI